MSQITLTTPAGRTATLDYNPSWTEDDINKVASEIDSSENAKQKVSPPAASPSPMDVILSTGKDILNSWGERGQRMQANDARHPDDYRQTIIQNLGEEAGAVNDVVNNAVIKPVMGAVDKGVGAVVDALPKSVTVPVGDALENIGRWAGKTYKSTGLPTADDLALGYQQLQKDDPDFIANLNALGNVVQLGTTIDGAASLPKILKSIDKSAIAPVAKDAATASEVTSKAVPVFESPEHEASAAVPDIPNHVIDALSSYDEVPASTNVQAGPKRTMADVTQTAANIASKDAEAYRGIKNWDQIPEPIRNAIKTPDAADAPTFADYAQAVTNGVDGEGKSLSDLSGNDLAGQQVLKAAQTIDKMRANVGARMSQVEQNIPEDLKMVDTTPIKQRLEESLGKFKIQIVPDVGENGEAVFNVESKSNLKSAQLNPTMKNELQNIVDDLYSNPSLSVEDLHNIDMRINDLTKTSFGPGALPQDSKVSAALKAVGGGIKDAYRQHVDNLAALGAEIPGAAEYSGLFQKYANLSRLQGALSRKLGAVTTDAAGGQTADRGASLIKAAVSNNEDRGTKALFRAVTDVTGTDLMKQAAYAKLAMELGGDSRQVSLLDAMLSGHGGAIGSAAGMLSHVPGMDAAASWARTGAKLFSAMTPTQQAQYKQAVYDFMHAHHPELFPNGRIVVDRTGTLKLPKPEKPASSGQILADQNTPVKIPSDPPPPKESHAVLNRFQIESDAKQAADEESALADYQQEQKAEDAQVANDVSNGHLTAPEKFDFMNQLRNTLWTRMHPKGGTNADYKAMIRGGDISPTGKAHLDKYASELDQRLAAEKNNLADGKPLEDPKWYQFWDGDKRDAISSDDVLDMMRSGGTKADILDEKAKAVDRFGVREALTTKQPIDSKYQEVQVPVSGETFKQFQVEPGKVFANYNKLYEKHPEQFKSPEEVKKHVEYVFTNPTGAIPASKDEYTIVYRRNGADKVVVTEFILRGGKYRVRSAYTMTEGQLDRKIASYK